MNKKKHVIGLTGATCAIGQVFIRYLSQKNDIEAYALVRRQPAYTGSNTHLIRRDLLNELALEQPVTKSDVIIHIAACNQPSLVTLAVTALNVCKGTLGLMILFRYQKDCVSYFAIFSGSTNNTNPLIMLLIQKGS